jgi:hypothetical protein
MIQAALHLDFSHEPQELAIADSVGVQDLRGLLALGGLMLYLKDPAHAARAKDGNDAILTDFLADVEAHIRSALFLSIRMAVRLSKEPEGIAASVLGTCKGPDGTKRPFGA